MVVHALDEQYPDFYDRFFVIRPQFVWQEEVLLPWCTNKRITLQGNCFVATTLSEAEEELLIEHCIPYEQVVKANDVD